MREDPHIEESIFNRFTESEISSNLWLQIINHPRMVIYHSKNWLKPENCPRDNYDESLNNIRILLP